MAYTNATGKTIYVNADRSKVVPEDSPEAAWVLVGDGGELPDEEAERYGLTESGSAAHEKAADPAQTKAVKKPPADK